MAIVLLDAFEMTRRTAGITMAFVFPVLMGCWAYAIWHFVQIGRISEEIKYLEKVQLASIGAATEPNQ